MKKCYIFVAFLMIAVFAGCSTKIYSLKKFPLLGEKGMKIAVVEFNNYTDTPDAGKRAANIVVGVLQAKGYPTLDLVNQKSSDLKNDQLESEFAASHLLEGGVSEWRYKTGIDGEPAVTLQLRLIDLKTGRVEWSSTGSTHSWGNSSIGSVALSMISKILK